jgi:hypothetical protein
MTTKQMTEPEYAAAVQEAIADLATTRDPYDHNEVLAEAGAFVARFGTLGDLFEQPHLSTLQFNGATGSPLWLLGHWSVARNDPAPQPPADYDAELGRCWTCRYLEGVFSLHTQFEYELCDHCGLDLDQHDIGVMGAGMGLVLAMCRPSTWCREQWTRMDPAATEGAWNPGRGQLEDAWEARWVAALADDTYAVLIRTFYLAQTGRRVYIEQETSYVVSEVADDPMFEGWLRSTNVYAEVDVDPESVNVKELAEQAPDPVHGEWAQNGPESAEFLLPRLAGGAS